MLPKIFSSTFKDLRSLNPFRKPSGKVGLVPSEPARPRKIPQSLLTVLKLQQPQTTDQPVYTCQKTTQVPEIPFVRPPCVCPKKPGLLQRLFGDTLRLFNIAVVGYLLKYSYDQGIWSDPENTARLSLKLQHKLVPVFPSHKNEPVSLEAMKYTALEVWNKSVRTAFYVMIQAPLNLYWSMLGKNIDPCDKDEKQGKSP